MIDSSYEIDERRNGFVFRVPADDDRALWRGPYVRREAAEKAALKHIENQLAEAIHKSLGFN